jgi:hypothetical protein
MQMLNGEVEQTRADPLAREDARGEREPEGLVSELVARNEDDAPVGGAGCGYGGTLRSG